jgi:hypothetical protein
LKKILYTFPLLAIFVSICLLNSGCKKDDEIVTPVVDTNVDKEIVSSKNYSQGIKIITDANAFCWAYATGNVVTGGCPNLYSDTISLPHELAIDYGAFPGCNTSSDGVKRSGKYTIVYSVNAAKDSIFANISFNDFRIYKYSTVTDTNIIRITGSMAFSSKKLSSTSYRVHGNGEIFLQTLSSGTKDLIISSLEGTANLNSLTTLSDDTYSLTGAGEITDNGNTFTISVKSSSPVQISSSCRYPLSGIVTFTKSGVSVDCDFSPESGTCDAIVKMVKGTFSKTVDLTTIDF